MKKRNSTFIILSLAFTMLTGCKKNDIAYHDDFEKSFKEWTSFKHKSDNSYIYVVGGGSWTGIGWETTLTVMEGRIVERKFRYMTPSDWDVTIPDDQKEWVESGEAINSHTGTPTAAAITLDEVYAMAKNFWLKKRENTSTYFESKNQGMISSCGFVNNGCQDDCFNGITITRIEPYSAFVLYN